MDLRGYEFYAATGLPVSGATVDVWNASTSTPGGSPLASTTTNADGQWAFTGLEDGAKDVKVSVGTRIRWYKGKTEHSMSELLLTDGLRAPFMGHQLLTNGGFDWWQRGAGPFTTPGSYSADAWYCLLNGGSSLSVTRDSANKLDFSRFCAKLVYTHVAESFFLQKYDDPGSEDEALSYFLGAGQSLSFSCWVKTATANAVRLVVHDDFTPTVLATSAYHTGSGNWEELRLTWTSGATPSYVSVGFDLKASCTAYLDNAMLVRGLVPAPYNPLTQAEEFRRCQRLYEIIGGNSLGPPVFHSYDSGVAVSHSFFVPWQTRKAGTTGTVSVNGTWHVVNCSQPTILAWNKYGVTLILVSTGVAGYVDCWPNSADDTITVEVNQYS